VGAKFELIGMSALVVRWRLGEGAQLTLLANLGDTAVEGIPLFAGKDIYLSQSDLQEMLASGRIPAWSAAWFIEEAIK
jgi:maltooligosyltrehalose trehalohydrolase